MGGNAFTSGPSLLSTPRMPPAVYFAFRTRYIDLLLHIYTQVATPVEAPCKSSYGDIDILVSGPKASPPPSTKDLTEKLAAEHFFRTSGSPTTSFAVPYPDIENQYVQIDVHECSSDTFEWQLFHQSHGDLWNLLGTTIRPFGLTATDQGLHVRIEEIEGSDRKKSLLLMTREPSAVVDFLGLDGQKYGLPFQSVEEMYEFVRGCRFFRAARYQREGLKANDRKRMAQREVYRHFVDDWIPKICEQNQRSENIGESAAQELTREGVLKESLAIFDKTPQYETRLSEWRAARAELLAKQEGRAKRKAEAAELDEYAKAWINSLDTARSGKPQ